LQPLPNAEKEVVELSNLFNGTFLNGDAANEHDFKTLAADYSIIHLAMHGVLNKRSPLLSSFAFTENGNHSENNFLQAYEISQMKLNASLVVLSACETGFGKFEQGNGIASLARSFMYAGVPSLVVSLWQVHDQSTEIIMKAFYKYIKEGLGKATALRQAKLDYLNRADQLAAHPAYWSPFIQLGATNPVILETKTTNVFWWILGLLSFFLVGGFILRNKKNK